MSKNKDVHCPRCAGKCVRSARNGRYIYTCPLGGGGRKGHGVVKTEPIPTAEAAPAQQPGERGPIPVPGIKQISVEDERAAAGLPPGTQSTGTDDVARMAAAKAKTSQGEEKPDYAALASSPGLHEWLKDDENKKDFVRAHVASTRDESS
jgi:hypothetical protein